MRRNSGSTRKIVVYFSLIALRSGAREAKSLCTCVIFDIDQKQRCRRLFQLGFQLIVSALFEQFALLCVKLIHCFRYGLDQHQASLPVARVWPCSISFGFPFVVPCSASYTAVQRLLLRERPPDQFPLTSNLTFSLPAIVPLHCHLLLNLGVIRYLTAQH